jgi:hypothetical protein
MQNLTSEQDRKNEVARKALLEKVDRVRIADAFPMFTTRQNLCRFVARYEIVKRILNTKGAIVECGVHSGASLLWFAQLSAIFEPFHYTRQIIGFDTFNGFPSVDAKDPQHATVGDFGDADFQVLEEAISLYDRNRPIAHIPKIELIKGDACDTIPQYIRENPHLLVSLLYLDFDLYKPTKIALETFVPRMPKGSIIAFDELGEKRWQGETAAFLELFKLDDRTIEALPGEPHVCTITV